MNLVLVDASAWIDYLRSGEGSLSETLEKLLDDDRAALCGIAITEVRQGLRLHEEGDVLDLFETLPFIESSRADYERAGELLAGLRRQGTTIPTMDGVMAALCLGRGMTLLEFGKHYGVMLNGADLYINVLTTKERDEAKPRPFNAKVT